MKFNIHYVEMAVDDERSGARRTDNVNVRAPLLALRLSKANRD